ncbi:hydroxyectoine utilization dehydratase EutB [Sneathiella sp.]|uniref:hydroxyectoine utilization dehydratase EutB n=1 Tax=Sneathiella sp. TaxID=1964365 RepID=UPI003561305E
MASIHLQDIYRARQRIASSVRTTPLVSSPSLSSLCDGNIHLKMEHLQITGSFKIRGATNAVLSLSDAQQRKGIVGVSTGNHGRGLAHAAAKAGVRCIICMSKLVPGNKVEAIKALGAEVCIIGQSQDEAQFEVDRLVREQGMVMLPPFDHADIIAGQGTVGLEILEDLPSVDTVLVPLSGGGLISGVALALKSANPEIRVIGISMKRGAAMIESQAAGKPIAVREIPTLADSLGGGVGTNNQYTFDMTRQYVDELITVSEPEIAKAIAHAYWQEKQVIEGAGSVGIAALMAGKIKNPGACVIVISGCNIDMGLHKRLIDGENIDMLEEGDNTGIAANA